MARGRGGYSAVVLLNPSMTPNCGNLRCFLLPPNLWFISAPLFSAVLSVAAWVQNQLRTNG